MSKYRIVFSQSRYKVAVVVSSHCFIVWSVFQWQASALQFQNVFQVGLGVAVLSSMLWHLIQSNCQEHAQVMVLCETGQCELEHMQRLNQWEICADSRGSAWLIWLKLRSVSEPADCFWLWVFRDQVIDDDFRRISRVVLRSQQANKHTL